MLLLARRWGNYPKKPVSQQLHPEACNQRTQNMSTETRRKLFKEAGSSWKRVLTNFQSKKYCSPRLPSSLNVPQRCFMTFTIYRFCRMSPNQTTNRHHKCHIFIKHKEKRSFLYLEIPKFLFLCHPCLPVLFLFLVCLFVGWLVSWLVSQDWVSLDGLMLTWKALCSPGLLKTAKSPHQHLYFIGLFCENSNDF